MSYEDMMQDQKGVNDPDWTQEEIEFEKKRLRGLLRNPLLPDDERKIVQAQLEYWE